MYQQYSIRFKLICIILFFFFRSLRGINRERTPRYTKTINRATRIGRTRKATWDVDSWLRRSTTIEYRSSVDDPRSSSIEDHTRRTICRECHRTRRKYERWHAPRQQRRQIRWRTMIRRRRVAWTWPRGIPRSPRWRPRSNTCRGSSGWTLARRSSFTSVASTDFT